MSDDNVPAFQVIDAGPIPTPIPERDEIPPTIPILPLRDDVAFPRVVMPLIISREKGIRLIDDVLKGDKIIGLATQKDRDVEDPTEDQLHSSICVANVLKMLKFPDGSTRIVVQGMYRGTILLTTQTEPYMVARINQTQELPVSGVEVDAWVLSLRRLFNQLIEGGGGQIPEELQVAVMNTRETDALVDLLASGLSFSPAEKLQMLAEADVGIRLRTLHQFMHQQVEMQNLASRIHSEVSKEINRSQKEQFLRQQMHEIRRELGEAEEETSEIHEFHEKIEALELPEMAAKEARRELDRMAQMHPSSPEYHVIRGFLDTLLSMPWNVSTVDRLDLRRAKRILDEDHYDLEKIKERILEFLAVRKLKNNMRGPILCLVGPPGVGKTSLGKSIARAIERKFIRISLGGVHDEAEIRGHRRTYIGAMPGRIIQGLRKLGTNNPVFMLDEIDKLSSDHRGDPSSALLEVLDPEQNNSFRDHYLDVEFDLSRILFICTANVVSTIPSALRDRMEVIELSGYSEEEKLAISHKFLIRKQIAENGLPPSAVKFSDEAIRALIQGYTRESGLRNLEREIASVCRKVARNFAEGKRRRVSVDPKKVHTLLGPAKFVREEVDKSGIPGVAHGLAWTPVGGEVLTIECVRVPGKERKLTLTGSLGDVMKESAQAAHGYLRSRADELEVPTTFFSDHEAHIHVPAGAIAKDGPSAGVALVAGLLSLALERPIRPKLAMTGEITLTGRILPVGGVREKLLAARREGFCSVFLPSANEKDTEELPKEVLDDLHLIFVRHMDEVTPRLFGSDELVRPKSGKSNAEPAGRRPGRNQPTKPQTPTPRAV